MVDITLGAKFAEWANAIILSMGYVGVFFVGFIGSATIFLPIPSFILVFALGAMMNPWLVGISAGVGSALGELTSYALGKGSGKIIERKYKNRIEKYRNWFKKDRIFPLIVFFAATPLPDDIIGILCGIFNYDLKKFVIASIIGKCILNIALAWAGFYGVNWIMTFFSGGL
jgi:membrane protein YqaA with SNARE-associated domain